MTAAFPLCLFQVCFECLHIMVHVFAYLPEDCGEPVVIEGEEDDSRSFVSSRSLLCRADLMRFAKAVAQHLRRARPFFYRFLR